MKKKTDSDAEIFLLNNQYVILSDLMTIPEGKTVELDLGCGSGDFTVGLAQKFPERLVFAADIMLNRIRKVVSKCRRAGVLESTRFFRVEARHLVSIILPDQCLDRLHVICPDPWPKNRHSGHRLISSDFMMQIHRVLKPGGIFHFATDDPPYLEAGTKNIVESGLFERVDETVFLADVADIKTEFERQWLAAGKAVPHTAWRKI